METPYFVIDEVQLDENIHQLKKALSERFPSHIMGYSFKTNALPWIITKMKAEGFMQKLFLRMSMH